MTGTPLLALEEAIRLVSYRCSRCHRPWVQTTGREPTACVFCGAGHVVYLGEAK